MQRKMTPQDFVAKWSQIRLKETAASQSHFNDVCRLVGHATPTELDPQGDFFTFEASTEKTGGQRGRADAWYKGKFVWEYKGLHADLDRAYQQLLLYRDALGNPPLLITSDLRTIILHTNFTNTIKEVHEITLERLLHEDGLPLLKRAFDDPASFRPAQTQQQVTQATAKAFAAVTDTLKQWEPDADPERLAHFIIRLLFCLYAEDMGLLPEEVFTKLVTYKDRRFQDFAPSLRALFGAMRGGGVYGFYPIPEFNGGLFEDEYVPELPSDIMDDLARACRQDWSSIDPSIFGTLFEGAIDPSKRAQLGAHYTSREDIMLIVEPVLMRPLRDKWQTVKHEARRLVKAGKGDEAHACLMAFSEEIAGTRVLDPACGSGNFLYVALRQLLDLQKEVIAFAGRQGLEEVPLSVSPAQLYGIEIDPYAHELAQTTIWIGYIQWRMDNGFPDIEEPILRPLDSIERKDAILAYDGDDNPVEPPWPDVDITIGNPPFLGGKKMRTELGDAYLDCLFQLYQGRVPHEADLVCYWFERARAQIQSQDLRRAGLLATNSIRGGPNRHVLDTIRDSGGIFMAWSDRPWVLDGAAVRVSMVGFDDGTETARKLNGLQVARINADLTSAVDLSESQRLHENANLSYMGVTPAGAFDTDGKVARTWIIAENQSGRHNSEVVRPYYNGTDLVRRPRDVWIVDFGVDMPEEQAALYELPFEHVELNVRPVRSKNRRKSYRERWWLLAETRPAMRRALQPLTRYLGTSMVSKHHVFCWIQPEVLPANLVIVIARDDDYFLGLVQSRTHELWALRQGTSLEDRPRYTPTSTFETFPFPWPPGQEPGEAEDERVAAIAQAARDLVALRQGWLHPPAEDVGVVISERMLKRRTLTNLYNALVHYRDDVKGKVRNVSQWEREVKGVVTLDLIEELDHVHGCLDRAALGAYGWPAALGDDEILERLLGLNLERAEKGRSQK